MSNEVSRPPTPVIPPSPNGNVAGAAFGANDDAVERPLAPLPSDNMIVRTFNIDICETILQTIVDNETHIHPNSLGSVAAYLWTDAGDGPFDGRFGTWSSDTRLTRNMKNRVNAILTHYSAWSDEDTQWPSQAQVLAKRIVNERNESLAEVEQRRATEQRQNEIRQDTANLREGVLGALPQRRGTGLPPLAEPADLHCAQEATGLLAPNPRSQNNNAEPVLPLPPAPAEPQEDADVVENEGNVDAWGGVAGLEPIRHEEVGDNEHPAAIRGGHNGGLGYGGRRNGNAGRTVAGRCAGRVAGRGAGCGANRGRGPRGRGNTVPPARAASIAARRQAQMDLARQAAGPGRGVVHIDDFDEAELLRRGRNTDFADLFDRVDGMLGENMRRLTDAIGGRNQGPAPHTAPPAPVPPVAAPTAAHTQPSLGPQITELYKRRKLAQDAGNMESSVRSYSRLIADLEQREEEDLRSAFGIANAGVTQDHANNGNGDVGDDLD